MRVKAIKTGYYGLTRIKADQVFEILKKSDFSKAWMEKLDKDDEDEVKSDLVVSIKGDQISKVPAPNEGKAKGTHATK